MAFLLRQTDMRTIAAALAFLLLGCSGPMTMGTMTMGPRTMGMERSPDYDAGFGDGCANAASQGPGVLQNPRRNEMLYANSADYRRGWGAGNVQCRAQLPNRL
jgi:hypothetical protein